MRFMYAHETKRWLLTVPPNGCLMVFDETELDMVEGIVEGLLELAEDEPSRQFLRQILARVTVTHDGVTN
jgi:hypothetical protein